MKEALMGVETEYCIHCDVKRLNEKIGDMQTYVNFTLKQVGSVLPANDFWVAYSTGDFWTRAGMRVYGDRSLHLEVATPECRTFEELIFQKNAGDCLAQALVDATRPVLKNVYAYAGPFAIYANNTAIDVAPFIPNPGGTETSTAGETRENKGEATFARHENYLLRKDMLWPNTEISDEQFKIILKNAGLFFISRPVIGGSGHITAEGAFVLSPRAAWATKAMHISTTSNRGVINTRDEPHCERSKFIRYHHIAGDTNITDAIMRMKMAFTYWVLRLLERGWRAPKGLCFEVGHESEEHFMDLARAINHDAALTALHRIGGARITARDILCVYLDAVDKNRGDILFEEEDAVIFNEVVSYLGRAKNGYEALVGESEWATKYDLIVREMRKKNIKDFNDPRLKKLSIVLHNLDKNPAENPFAEFRTRVLPENLDVGDVVKACRTAPRTRAYIRGLAVYLAKKFGVNIHFGPGSEWNTISLPASPDGRIPYLLFDLSSRFPWEIAADDLKNVVQLLKQRFMFPPEERIPPEDPSPYLMPAD